jgi:hypothetical protein
VTLETLLADPGSVIFDMFEGVRHGTSPASWARAVARRDWTVSSRACGTPSVRCRGARMLRTSSTPTARCSAGS